MLQSLESTSSHFLSEVARPCSGIVFRGRWAEGSLWHLLSKFRIVLSQGWRITVQNTRKKKRKKKKKRRKKRRDTWRERSSDGELDSVEYGAHYNIYVAAAGLHSHTLVADEETPRNKKTIASVPILASISIRTWESGRVWVACKLLSTFANAASCSTHVFSYLSLSGKR